MLTSESALETLKPFLGWGFLTESEESAIRDVLDPGFSFAAAVALAETLHVHVKVDDVDALPRSAISGAGGEVEYEKEGFIKFSFEGGTNVIFSSIPVSQDELVEAACGRRSRPFVDHLGIDLRAETEPVAEVFRSIPGLAQSLGWEYVTQGGAGKKVYCCHVEVKQKHWVYPPAGCDDPSIPLEFAFGELKIGPVSGGCDLRPMDPSKAATMEKAIPCCPA